MGRYAARVVVRGRGGDRYALARVVVGVVQAGGVVLAAVVPVAAIWCDGWQAGMGPAVVALAMGSMIYAVCAMALAIFDLATSSAESSRALQALVGGGWLAGAERVLGAAGAGSGGGGADGAVGGDVAPAGQLAAPGAVLTAAEVAARARPVHGQAARSARPDGGRGAGGAPGR